MAEASLLPPGGIVLATFAMTSIGSGIVAAILLWPRFGWLSLVLAPLISSVFVLVVAIVLRAMGRLPRRPEPPST